MTVQSKYSRYALSEIAHCGECGSRFRRCTWRRGGESKIVWRCTSRIESGNRYCKCSPSVPENELHDAIVRAVNRFYKEDTGTYKTLLKVSLNEALGMSGGTEKINLLSRRIDALNRKMMDLVNETVADGGDVDSKDAEFKEISDEIEQLNSQIETIKAAMEADREFEARVREISEKVESLQNGMSAYDDTVVRQTIECVRIFPDGKTEIIFGGGIVIEENVTPLPSTRGRKKKES